MPSVVQTVPNDAAELVDVALKKFKAYDGDLEAVHPYDKAPGGGAGVPK